jgi:hypothetical protein
MRAEDRLKWAIYCGYKPYRRLYYDCSGLITIYGGRE